MYEREKETKHIAVAISLSLLLIKKYTFRMNNAADKIETWGHNEGRRRKEIKNNNPYKMLLYALLLFFFVGFFFILFFQTDEMKVAIGFNVPILDVRKE